MAWLGETHGQRRLHDLRPGEYVLAVQQQRGETHPSGSSAPTRRHPAWLRLRRWLGSRRRPARRDRRLTGLPVRPLQVDSATACHGTRSRPILQSV